MPITVPNPDERENVMSVMIGIDPHKLLHAACAIDRSEEELGQLQVRSGPRQLSELLSWATRFEQRTWAIESAGGLGYLDLRGPECIPTFGGVGAESHAGGGW